MENPGLQNQSGPFPQRPVLSAGEQLTAISLFDMLKMQIKSWPALWKIARETAGTFCACILNVI